MEKRAREKGSFQERYGPFFLLKRAQMNKALLVFLRAPFLEKRELMKIALFKLEGPFKNLKGPSFLKGLFF
jgi:hypothetical protein